MKRVYVETSVISYLTARTSTDPAVAGHQLTTQRWWDERRAAFEVLVSELVVREVQGGDLEMASKRLAAINGIPVLSVSGDAGELAKRLITRKLVPERAIADATHIATAALNGIDYLLTWNCTHIANAETRRTIENFLAEEGYESPVLCTPDELMGGEDDVG